MNFFVFYCKILECYDEAWGLTAKHVAESAVFNVAVGSAAWQCHKVVDMTSS